DDHPWESGLVNGLPVAQWGPWELSDERLAEVQDQWQLDERSMQRLCTPLTCALDGGFKLVMGPEGELLYDLAGDPLERSPLTDGDAMAARAGDALGRLRAAVESPAAQARPEIVPAPDSLPADEVADLER